MNCIVVIFSDSVIIFVIINCIIADTNYFLFNTEI